MNPKHSPGQEPAFGIAIYALLFLVFLQLLSDLIETTYTFGLLGTSIPPEIVSVLFLLTPVLLVFFPRALESRAFALTTGELALLCRAVSLVLDTRGKMLVAGLGVGLFLLYLPAMLWQNRGRLPMAAAGSGLAFSSLLSIVLRAVNFGTDLSAAGGWTFTGWGALLLFAALGLAEWYRLAPSADPAGTGDPLPFWKAAVLSVGLASTLVLLYFGFAAPTVIDRWSGLGYPLVTALITIPLAVFTGLWAGLARFRQAVLARPLLLAWNGLFALALALALRGYSIAFPSDPAAYPLAEPAAGGLAAAALVAALLLHPVIFADFALLARSLSDGAATPRCLGGATALSAVWVLLLAFAHVFTTVYDYIPVIGPMFRDRFWLVYTIAALGMTLPVLFARRKDLPAPGRARLSPAVTAVLLAAVAVISANALSARPQPAVEPSTLRVLTYNIQQGYDANGNKSFDAQLALIRQANPDILGLQETDTARLAGGNADVVRYFADQLNMYSYYGPKTTTGTFGIALLSRYPIHNPRTFFMYSTGEQTAAIQAEIDTGSRVVHVLVTHLGNKGPVIQQQQVLERLAGQENIIAMGDFNFRPGGEQYALTTSLLEDAWLLSDKQLMDPPGQNADRRIDHIFVSPGLRVLNSMYIGEGPSDHPAMFAEIGW